MIKVSLVGTGNVAQHLFDAFLQCKEVTITQVIGRNEERLDYFGNHTKTTRDFRAITDSDITIIATSDDSISTVSQYFNTSERLVVHTSGSVGINALAPHRKGVFYPLQTFTEGQEMDLNSIPICIEAENRTDLKLLHRLAETLSDKVYEISSEQRKSLHLAAVFVNNFTNHLYQIGAEICKKNKVSFDLLKPLIMETSNKVQTLSPKEAQTGPARRKDQKTLGSHLQQLQNKNRQKIYRIMTQSIQETYGEKL